MSSKKSDFTAQSVVPSGSTFDFVYQGQNYKITYANLLTALNVVGTLVQKGEITGLPILTINGTVHEIKNLISGVGITVSETAEGGANIAHNFTNGTGGAPLIADITAAQTVIKSLVAGDGITISGSSGSVQISVTGTTPVSTQTTIVNSMSDFPTASLGVITLADDTDYFVTNNLSTANRFVLGNRTVLRAADAQVIKLSYTGTDVMFTSVNSTNNIKDITCEALTGTLFAWSSTLPDNDYFQLNNFQGFAAAIGSVTGVGALSFTDTRWVVTTGMTIVGTSGLLSFTDSVVTITTGKLFDLGTSTLLGLSLRNTWIIAGASVIVLSGLINSGNIVAGSLANVINTRLLGSTTFLENITIKDDLWEFHQCDGVADSFIGLLATHAGATIAISTINTPVLVGATWTTQEFSRMTGTAAGRWTYTGKGGHVGITFTITAEIALSSDDCTFYIYKNGAKITESAILRKLTAGAPGNMSLVWSMELATNDYIELFVENNDTTVDVVINKAIARIQG